MACRQNTDMMFMSLRVEEHRTSDDLSDKAALGELYDDSEIDLALNLVDQGLSGFAALSLIDRLAGIRSSLRDGKLSQEDADAHALAATQMALHKSRMAS